MKRKIFNNMVYIAVVAVLITPTLLGMFTYYRYMEQVKSGIKDEAAYLAASLNVKDNQNLNKYKNITVSRITRVDQNGKVIYDSSGKEKSMGNHKNRTEIKEAYEKGQGEDTRMSNTLRKQTYYYAVRLKDGTILRMSRETQTIIKQMEDIIPIIMLMLAVVTILSMILSKMSTDRIVEPINQIDLIHPKKNKTYSELTPLLDKIEKQNMDIERQIKEIKEAENMRKEFSANVSHELKTPLTTISGYAELMKDGLVKPEDMPRFSATIYDEARRLISMIEGIIKLSRLDENRVQLDWENVDLYELAFTIKNDLTRRSQEEKVAVHIRGVHTKIRGVQQILYEMFFNICENAIKYNHKGGEVVFTISKMNDYPIVIVEDTGIGIPKEDLDRIFERFYRVDKSHSNQKKGSGLGLSIVKHGAKFHNAEMEVDSELGKGTKITIIFPKQKSDL